VLSPARPKERPEGRTDEEVSRESIPDGARGLGGQGRKWADICRKHGDVDVVGFADPSEASRRRATAEWGVPEDRLFDSVPRALERTSPDFVLDVSPPAPHHREIALASFASRPADPPGETEWSDRYAVGP